MIKLYKMQTFKGDIYIDSGYLITDRELRALLEKSREHTTDIKRGGFITVDFDYTIEQILEEAKE